ncbi:MAG: hypothetical protein R3212_05640 [Xanthomonadales bacterium]|nr:hypothetical protein [Xanthomonadales bacterium]
MTPQSLDAVVALVPVEPTREMVRAGTFDGILTPNQACASFQAQVLAAPDWHPTPQAINARPPPLPDDHPTIQTSHPSYDNAVKVKLLEEKVAMLERALGEAECLRNLFRRACVVAKAQQYRHEGMKVEQARIHAEAAVEGAAIMAIDAMAAGPEGAA